MNQIKVVFIVRATSLAGFAVALPKAPARACASDADCAPNETCVNPSTMFSSCNPTSPSPPAPRGGSKMREAEYGEVMRRPFAFIILISAAVFAAVAQTQFTSLPATPVAVAIPIFQPNGGILYDLSLIGIARLPIPPDSYVRITNASVTLLSPVPLPNPVPDTVPLGSVGAGGFEAPVTIEIVSPPGYVVSTLMMVPGMIPGWDDGTDGSLTLNGSFTKKGEVAVASDGVLVGGIN